MEENSAFCLGGFSAKRRRSKVLDRADQHFRAKDFENARIEYQKVLQSFPIHNLAPGVTNGSKVVAILGSNVGSSAEIAALSAFNNSSLPGLGWTATTYNDAALQTYLQGGLANTGIVMMDSAGNVGGGTTGTELGYFTANAANINTYLANGGGFFSQANGYAWVSALVPGLGVTSSQNTGLGLTADGTPPSPASPMRI